MLTIVCRRPSAHAARSAAAGLPFLLALVTAATSPAGAQTRLLRFPDLHGDRVTFTYAGDLWAAPAAGGDARRLTSHPGLELFAKFSPDGEWIAFTGQYDGDEQVYVIPAAGGVPRQLTFYPAAGPLPPRWGYDNQVYGWTPDGSAVLFRSMRDGSDLADTRLYTVPREGGLPVALPMPQSGAGDFSPDGARVVYSPLVRDFRHWKRYQGGWAQDLYLFDLATHELTQITDHPRSDRDPMWIGESVHFASDRTGTLNLYAYDLATGATRQLTDSDVWDVRWPSADAAGRRIVYELNGELEIYDLASGDTTRLAVRVPTDALAARPSRVPAGDLVEGYALSPGGKRVAFAARGEIFSVPVEHGPVRNLTRSPGAHDREPAWSPDGAWIAYVSDVSGEEEVYVVAQDGAGEPRRVTHGNGARLSQLLWSPDGARIAFRDQRARLYVVEVESGRQVEVADDRARDGLDPAWSPDGAHLAFSLADDNGFRSLHLWSVGGGPPRRLTGELFHEFSPAWDPAGNYLYFLGDRELRPQIGSFEFNYVVNRESHVYALALREDVPHPFPPRSDEVEVDGDEGDDEEADSEGEPEEGKGRRKDRDEEGDEGEKEEAEDGGPSPVRIEFEGLAERVARTPIEAHNYAGVAAVEGHLLYVSTPAFYYGRDGDHPVELKVFSVEDREETVLASGVEGVALSPDGAHVLVQIEEGFEVREASPAGADEAKVVSTGGMVAERVPRAEWAQMFDEVWRLYRDFFYVENLHGYDWAGLRERYRPLLEHVAHRSDLNYVLSEMIAELNVSHAYVAGGDFEMPERPSAGLLGARFELDPESGRYRFARIFTGDNAEEVYRAPLTEVGVEVEEGEYLLAVNGQELAAPGNPFQLLRHAGGEVVELTVAATPSGEGRRRVLVEPLSSEDDLIYLAWVEGNRRYVEERSDGRLGYLHLPDMSASGLREFIKWYYGQIRRQGLVIDVRSNGGGNVSPMIIERLRRQLLMLDWERNAELIDTYPDVVFHGHLVCLLDEDTASDGDQFAQAFRLAGLGPLVGKRSWGGVVGIYGGFPLLDGGSVTVPEAGSGGADGGWVIEGHGVDPDVVVENEPRELLRGRDQQLERAVDLLLEAVEREPREFPERPQAPVKTE